MSLFFSYFFFTLTFSKKKLMNFEFCIRNEIYTEKITESMLSSGFRATSVFSSSSATTTGDQLQC